jgi:hypothetical protein
MKMLKTLGISLLLGAALVSCSKNDDATTFNAVGKWEGKLIDGSSGLATFYGLQLNGDGTLTRYKSTGEILATGNWQLVGDSIKANYEFLSGSKFSIAGKIERSIGKMNGTWGSGSNPKGLGTWNASRK